MNRKNFLQQAFIGTSGFLVTPFLSVASGQHDNNDPLPPEKVKAFVIAGHGNLEEVKKLLLELPTLLYATWDWGNGDFETALEGAGHMGQKEIAHFLINQGARTNLFVLTMLGRTTIVKTYLEAFPQYLTARGPHGLTFLHHAQKGGDDAKELLDFFQSKGLKETKLAL